MWGRGASQGALEVKNLPANAGDARDTGSIPVGGKIPWWGKRQPTLVFLPGKFHGQKSLEGCCPCGHKELDMINQLSTHMGNRPVKVRLGKGRPVRMRS